MKIVEQSAKLLSMTPDPLFLIERCGRVCYKSEDNMTCGTCRENYEVGASHESMTTDTCPECLERATKFVQGIIKRGHESVLEHASATVLLTTDRGMSHELVRHRIAAYSQESTRYCNYGNKGGEITVIKPDLSEFESEYENGVRAAEMSWASAVGETEAVYLALTKAGVAPQHARSVLPTCLKTEIVVTANFRQWRHMMGLRLGNKAGKAHPQIRELFKLILNEFMKTEASTIFEESERQ